MQLSSSSALPFLSSERHSMTFSNLLILFLNTLSEGDYLVLTQSYYEKYKAFGDQFKQKKIHFRDQDIYIFVKK